MRFLLIVPFALLAACSSGTDEVRELIESESSLQRLERQVGWTVAAALEQEPASGLAAEQAQWQEALQRCIEAEDRARCLAQAHQERLAALQTRYDLTPRLVALHAATDAGYLYRATGNEPGWILLLAADHAVWETDYGQTRHEIDKLEREIDGRVQIYRGQLEGNEVEIRVEETACSDDMSGEGFAVRIEIRNAGKTYRGCADRTGT